MRLMLRVIGAVIGVLAWTMLFNLSLRWIGEPNTMQATAGLLLSVCCACVAFIAARRAIGQSLGAWSKFLPLLVVAVWASACTRVDPGHVGIQVNYYGTDRGVESYPRVTGMVWYNPISTKVFEYPTYVQTAKWTRSITEGAPTNEEITFTNADGMSISADISLSYHLLTDRVPAFYVKFRNDDLDQFTHGFLRNLAREKFDTHGGRYKIDDIMGNNAPFLKDVRDDLQRDLAPLGVQLDQFGLIGAPRPPQAVIDAINAKVHATQLAIQKQNELVQAQADAAKEVAKTEGYAKAITIRADAEAAANRKLADSLTPTLIELKRLEKWNGVLPTVQSGAVPLFNLK